MKINIGAFLNNYKKTPIFEYSMGELRDNSDSPRRDRAKTLLTYYIDLESGPDGHARTIWKVPSQSNAGLNYTVTVAIIPSKGTLFSIAKSKWDAKTFVSVLKSSDVKVHCTCADFYYGGAKYALGAGKYQGALEPKNAGYPKETIVVEPPDIKDPQRQRVLCKHCIAVADRFGANSFKIMKTAKDYNITIQPTAVDTKKTKMPLKKDITLVDMDKEQANKITEGIVHGAEEVNADELQKNQMSPEEDIDVVETVTETKPELEETPEVTPEKQTTEQKSVALEKDKVVEEPNKKMDSNLNEVNKKSILIKDTRDTEKSKEEVDDILERPKEDSKQSLEIKNVGV